MSGSVKAVKKEYAEIRTSKDGRRYVTVSDVLNSPAGQAEIRRQSENFKVVRNEGNANDTAKNNSNGSGLKE
jgi:hypothetical protein